jgi:hypothetical protein
MIYLFENPRTGEIKEIYQPINDVHEYSENGVKFNRIFTTSQIVGNLQCDPHSEKDFRKTTTGKNMTWGEMWDHSAELSYKREIKDGKDKVKEDYFKSYSKKRRGVKHNLETGQSLI